MLRFPRNGRVFSAVFSANYSPIEVADAIWSAATRGHYRPLFCLLVHIEDNPGPYLPSDWRITRPGRLGFTPDPSVRDPDSAPVCCKPSVVAKASPESAIKKAAKTSSNDTNGRSCSPNTSVSSSIGPDFRDNLSTPGLRPDKKHLNSRNDWRGAFLWGDHYPRTRLPQQMRRWGFWVGLSQQGHWPTALLAVMAREDNHTPLTPPRLGIAPYAAILAGWVATIYGASLAIQTWESLNLASNLRQTELRWRLLFLRQEGPIVPPEKTSEQVLERLTETLEQADPGLLPIGSAVGARKRR